jgi:hypothetical protein
MARVFQCWKNRALTAGMGEDELAVKGGRHLAEADSDLVGKLSRELVLAKAKEA